MNGITRQELVPANCYGFQHPLKGDSFQNNLIFAFFPQFLSSKVQIGGFKIGAKMSIDTARLLARCWLSKDKHIKARTNSRSKHSTTV